MDLNKTLLVGPLSKLKRNKRVNDRKSIHEIVEILSDIECDLQTLSSEKAGHVARLEREKKELETMIAVVNKEKDRGEKIFKNIATLLGD